MASKSKKATARPKRLRPSRQPRSAPVKPAKADEGQFVFKFSFGDTPGAPVGCVIDVVAASPGATLARARAVVDSMQMGVTVTSDAEWPDDDDEMDAAMCMEYARVYFGEPRELTLKSLIMISDMEGTSVDVDPRDLKPTTSVGRLFNR